MKELRSVITSTDREYWKKKKINSDAIFINLTLSVYDWVKLNIYDWLFFKTVNSRCLRKQT